MKITISNLGVVKKAEIDVKPLTILVGENNTGKTWLAYTLAGTLGQYGWRRYVTAYVAGKTTEKYPKLDNIVRQITNNGEGVLDIIEFADKYGAQCINNILKHTRTWLHRFIGTERIKFATLNIEADIVDIKEALLNKLQAASITDMVGQDEDSASLRALKEPGERKLFFYPGRNITERLPTRAIKEFVSSIVFRELLQFFYLDIHTFPTERTSINDFILTLPPKSLTRSIAEGTDKPYNDEIISILSNPRPQSWPISNFLRMLANIYNYGSLSHREEEATEDHAIQYYMQLATILQEDILGGKLDFSTPEPGHRREVLYQPAACINDQKVELEVSVSSSMIKELSSLVLYLRYIAKPGELLVIDEPEMNLHPAAQLKIIEFLVMLVNAGLHVLITTHSPYVVDHLVNLMDASKHQNQDEIVEMFLLERKEAFLSQDKVSVYLVNNDGELQNILNPKGWIDWQTFNDVTKLVQRIHFEL